MNELIILRGLPGSGKSTLAKNLVKMSEHQDNPFVFLESDMYFMKDGEYCFDADKLSDAHRWCFNATRGFLRMESNVIVAGVFTRKSHYQNYIDLAKQFGAKCTVLTVENNHGNKSIHEGIPQDKIESMRRNFEFNLK